MSALRRFASGLRALMRRSREDADLDRELRAYLDDAIEANVRAGMSRGDAVRAARVHAGSLAAARDHTRDVGWEIAVETWWRDLRYAGRALRKSPAFTVVAVTTLALGVGANSAIFSVVNAFMLRPLPVPRPHELIALSTVYRNGVEPVFSYPAYRRFVEETAGAGEMLAASSVRREALVLDGPPEPVDFKWISGNYFSVLEVQAALGRTVLPADDRLPAGEPVAVLSHAYWMRRFAGDPSAVGRTFRLRARPFTIVGIAPAGFFGETGGEAPDLWLPMTAQPDAPPWLWKGHSTTWLGLVMRLDRGLDLPRARGLLEPSYDRIREEVASGTDSAEFRTSVLNSRLLIDDAKAGSSRLRGELTAPLMILMSLVGLVLLIACANVANLMLARGESRRRQTAVCLAIGAGRTRVIRQAIAEALLLALGGALAGLVIADLGSSLLAVAASTALPLSIEVRPDVRVVTFTLVTACATALLFGLMPAIRAARIDPLPALKGASGGAVRGATRARLRRALVVSQIALSLVLLVSAGLFIRTLSRLQEIPLGFDREQVLLFELGPPSAERPLDVEQRRNLVRSVLSRAASLPGVHSASASFSGLFTRGMWRNAVTVEGFVPAPGVTPRTFANAISPGYFDVMRMSVTRGRSFTDADRASSPRVAIVNQTFARQFFNGGDPVGRRAGFCQGNPCVTAQDRMMEIVGLVEDAKYYSVREESRPMLFVPLGQYEQNPRQLEVRTDGDPAAVAATLHRELSAVDSRLALVGMRQLKDQVDRSILGERLAARLSGVFGLLALALAAVGLYGVVAYVTAQRAGEIGVRVALGAGAREVRRLVLRDTLVLVAGGLVVGLPAALGAAQLLSSQLYGVGPTDPVAVASAIVVLVLAALVAGYLPARRAATRDPLVALRAE